MKPQSARYLAVQEHELAVLAFAEAMRQADFSYFAIIDSGLNGPRFTEHMKAAWNRYLVACWRLVNEKN